MTETSDSQTGTVVFDRRRGVAPGMMLIALAFVAVGSWFVAQPDLFASSSLARMIARLGISGEAFITGFGLIAVAFGLAAGYGWFRHFRNAAPVVILTEEGLSVDAGTLKMTELPWDEVIGTRMLSIAGTDMLGVLVSDPARVIAQQRLAGRLAARTNTRMYETPVYIPASMIEVPLDELQEAIEAYRIAHAS